MNMKLGAGIDVGSCTTKAAIVDSAGNLVAFKVVYSGNDFAAAAGKVWGDCLCENGVNREDILGVVSTGYGRNSVDFACRQVTEISCHGRGCLNYFSGPITVIDIGGQDNKIIKLDEHGRRVSFKMNRKCAAGTGAFLEEMAMRLRLPVDKLNHLAMSADGEVSLGSYCTVFTGTEVLEKIKMGQSVERIVRGLFHSVVKRIVEMDTLSGAVVLTGGVIEYNPFLATLLEQYTENPVMIPPHPQIIGALGAALYALES
jgi:(R)-2-hydroxyacyl-CoA dehydratese activating ATPase